jgi:DNA polymerase III subunit delta'
MSDVVESPVLSLPLPWQVSVWQQLQRSYQAGRLPHALLLHGAAGLGKLSLAHWLAQALLCEARDGELEPCGSCASCRLYRAGTHPDLMLVAPEEDKQQISVEQIRAANERLGMTSSRSGYRIAIVDPAHQMTIAAANSLLKTLEEPGANSLLILVTSNVSALLPTIRSRCQQLGFATPAADVAITWLAGQTGKSISADLLRQACGAPLKALEYAQGSFESLRQSMEPAILALEQGGADLTELAQSWADNLLGERLTWLDGWLCQRLHQEIVRTADPITRESRQAAGQVLNISNMFQTLDKIRELKAQLRRTALQRELALDVVLLMLQRALTNKI